MKPRQSLLAALVATACACALAAEPAVDTSRFLRKHFWIIETRAVPGREIPPAMMQAHLANQVRLEKAGILFAAGPVATEGEAGFGMIVVRAGSRDEARQIADSDPLHRDGYRRYVLRDWMVNEGRLRVTVDFSDGTYRLE